jgi:hypothetical protein
MKFEDVMSKIEGAHSVGGQLIVNKGGVNILVGKQVQGMLIVEDTDEARLIVFEATGVAIGVAGEDDDPEPKTHHVEHHDEVKTKDAKK